MPGANEVPLAASIETVPATPAVRSRVSGRQRGYVLALLTVILAFNSVDRLALGLVMQDIKAEFHLSDTQLGLMSGFAFALFFSLMGIPIARWADRGNRVTLITVTTALFSGCVALCGAVASFTQLLAIRVGVAIGDAGCMPTAQSLISDFFSRAERPRALGIYLLGGPLSTVIGYLVAGWLNEQVGWRNMFFILGALSLPLVPLAWFFLVEPRRKTAIASPDHAIADLSPAVPPAPLRDVLLLLWNTPTFRHLLLSFTILSYFANGIGTWKAAFLVRSYGIGTAELGVWLTLVYGGGAFIGVYLGGYLAARYAAHDEARQLRWAASLLAIFSLLSSLVYVGLDKHLVFLLMFLCAVGNCMGSAPQFALIQSLVPNNMRAVATTLMFLCANLVGMGLAPLGVGVLSDALRPLVGEDSLRYALFAFCPGYVWAAWHLFRASRTVASDFARRDPQAG